MDSDIQNMAGTAILEAVENQLESNDPPKARETLKRLLAEGIVREEALKYIASALSVEIFSVLKKSEPFNPERYDRNLDDLPDMPCEDEK